MSSSTDALPASFACGEPLVCTVPQRRPAIRTHRVQSVGASLAGAFYRTGILGILRNQLRQTQTSSHARSRRARSPAYIRFRAGTARPHNPEAHVLGVMIRVARRVLRFFLTETGRRAILRIVREHCVVLSWGVLSRRLRRPKFFSFVLSPSNLRGPSHSRARLGITLRN
jgi:hypothetical protein